MRRYRNYQAMQRGGGLGSILGKMFRFARPLLTSGLRAAKPHLIEGGKSTAKALLEGKPLKQTLVEQGKKFGLGMLEDQLSGGSRNAPRRTGRKRAKRKVHIQAKRRKKSTAYNPFA